MKDTTTMRTINVVKNGPYIVKGSTPLAIQTITPNAQGGSWEWTEGTSFGGAEQYALCRCGQSANKPFCDGTHSRVDFDGTETASHESYNNRAQTFEGQSMVLKDDQPLCAFARFCDNDGSVWKQIHRPSDEKLDQLLEHEVTRCPSGRLVLLRAGKNDSEPQVVEATFDASIGIVEDPGQHCSGPLWVRGLIPITSATGETYETRNRATLCRCGASNNKPFCDGSHATIHFNDDLSAMSD